MLVPSLQSSIPAQAGTLLRTPDGCPEGCRAGMGAWVSVPHVAMGQVFVSWTKSCLQSDRGAGLPSGGGCHLPPCTY